MRSLRNIILALAAMVVGAIVSGRAYAATFTPPKNQAYQVTYINPGAYQTKHQFAIFNGRGHVIYVPVEDFAAGGKPIVDDQATTAERQAPRLIHRYLTNRRARNQAASQTGFIVRPNQRVQIKSPIVPQPTTGKVKTGPDGGFTITMPAKCKYQTVQFKPAPSKYQIKK